MKKEVLKVKKQICSLLCIISFSFSSINAQLTKNPACDVTNTGMMAMITDIVIDNKMVKVVIDCTPWLRNPSAYVKFTNKTYLSYVEPTTGNMIEVPISEVRNWRNSSDAVFVPFNSKIYGYNISTGRFVLVFHLQEPLPNGLNRISIEEKVRKGFIWRNIHIRSVRTETIANFGDINKIDSLLNESKSIYTGVYENLQSKNTIAFIWNDDAKEGALLCYSDSKSSKIGDILATLSKISGDNTSYIGFWYDYTFNNEDRVLVTFEGSIMKILVNHTDGSKREDTYVKVGTESPNTPTSHTQEWSGTGFALNNGYVVTNCHVVDGALEIKIGGVEGDFTQEHKARVIGVDKNSDLALLKLEDNSIAPKPPYSFTSATSNVGEDVFVLGYPMTQTMGEEIKLTNGIISAKSGYDGDISNYQISVPLQPGNSGGPLFDKNGVLVGVVCAKHAAAENVSYAIKSMYLKNLVESIASTEILPNTNKLVGKSLPEQVKDVKNYVYMIKCSK